MSNVRVNSRVHKYKEAGIKSFSHKSGQGGKPLLNKEDEALLLKTVKSDRRRLQAAKAERELQSVKSVSRSTLVRFLKSPVKIQTHKTSP